jgi:hypothetical protein
LRTRLLQHATGHWRAISPVVAGCIAVTGGASGAQVRAIRGLDLSLLGKEAYWQTASGRRSVTRPDTEVVTLDVQPGDDNA